MSASRRLFVLSAMSLGFAAPALADEALCSPDNLEDAPDEPFQPGKDLPGMLAFKCRELRLAKAARNLGKDTPDVSYFDIADQIVAKAPTNCRPIDVAYWLFYNLPTATRAFTLKNGQDFKPEKAHDFTREWYKDYNPMIVRYFKEGTPGYPPSGDCTRWCAAFVNWCIFQAQKGRSDVTKRAPKGVGDCDKPCIPGTKNPSSITFVNDGWGCATTAPVEGDIAVYGGHVAFVVMDKRNPTKITLSNPTILGGNQANGMGAALAKEYTLGGTTCPGGSDAGGQISMQSYGDAPQFRTHSCLHDRPIKFGFGAKA